MGIGISSAQTLLELQSSGHLSEVSSVCDMGATEIHITKTDLKELLSQTKINLSKSIDDSRWYSSRSSWNNTDSIDVPGNE